MTERSRRDNAVFRGAVRASLAVTALLIACVLTLVIAALPAAALAREALSGAAVEGVQLERPWLSLAVSLAWAVGAACVGTLIAWPASRVFRRDARSPGALVAASVTVLPLALPPWLLYAALWMNAGPGTALGDWAERHDLVPAMRMAILSTALVTWCASIACAVLCATGPRGLSADERLLTIDGASGAVRLHAALARDARSMLVAIFLSAAFLLCEATVYDLAQVPTLGFELRTLDALGAAPGDVVRAALPALVLAIAAALCIPRAARALGDARLRARGARVTVTPRRGTISRILSALPAALVLLALLRVGASISRAGDFLVLHGRAFATAIGAALAVAAVVALLAASLRVLLTDMQARPIRVGAIAIAVVIAGTGFAPPTLTALSVEAAYNTAALAPVYDSPFILVVALAARAAPIAAVAAIAFAAREPVNIERLRALDAVSLPSAWRGLRHELMFVAVGSGTIAFAWSLGELTASGRVVPPGVPWIATDILNAIHYQRPDTVLLASVALVLVALPVAITLVQAMRRVQRAHLSLFPACILASLLSGAILPGCGESRSDGTPQAVDPSDPDGRVMDALRSASPAVKDALAVSRSIGGAGRGKGQFYGPRVLAVDRASGDTYVIDKDARVQAFTPEGVQRAEWRMPKRDRGKPTGASVAPDGTLVVADTHEHRIVGYSPTGETRWTFGEYGTGPGQFIYPTDIVFLPDGRLLVSEYGGNDRIQAFGTDHRFMHQFGRSGTGEGEFLRPQAMAYDAERDELYVLDAGNHRVQVFTSDGEVRRILGKTGLGPGELNYPFGIALLIGGRATDALGQAGEGDHSTAQRTVVIAEHSNHRVQVLDGSTGESLAIAGGIGRELGRLKYPWAVEPAGVSADGSQRFALCDHGNSRIVFFTLPAGP